MVFLETSYFYFCHPRTNGKPVLAARCSRDFHWNIFQANFVILLIVVGILVQKLWADNVNEDRKLRFPHLLFCFFGKKILLLVKCMFIKLFKILLNGCLYCIVHCHGMLLLLTIFYVLKFNWSLVVPRGWNYRRIGDYRKTVKATLMLVPLLGIPNLLVFYKPDQKAILPYYMLSVAVLQNSQVSLILD